jgi:hypothetical protein
MGTNLSDHEFDWENVTCSRHDIPEKLLFFSPKNNHSLTPYALTVSTTIFLNNILL